MSEELRLLYVALTRAKDELQVHVPLRYHTQRFGRDDNHLYAQLSRFIEPVRHHFDETVALAEPDPTLAADLTVVGVADEVDVALASLWE